MIYDLLYIIFWPFQVYKSIDCVCVCVCVRVCV